ncbi:Hydrolase, haloacid dehalogenase-like family protein [Minicystis rosea]|nr:Hydrolase, haloacid dehalogenase-like family protein [Minicystis rosea]
MKRPTVLLFDIDGTLLDTGGAGRRALEKAFDRLHRKRDACAGISFGGMTDRAICRAGLTAIGEEVTAPAVDGLLDAYLEALADELAASTRARIHEGIVAALDAATRVGCAVGLGTGNIEAGARLKLLRVGIWDRFAFGGYGSDHEIRSELLRIGAERGAAQLGVTRAECRVVVIGDTPKDITAAHAIDAECVAVATGSFEVQRLAEHGPRWVFRSLLDDGALQAVLEGQ